MIEVQLFRFGARIGRKGVCPRQYVLNHRGVQRVARTMIQRLSCSQRACHADSTRSSKSKQTLWMDMSSMSNSHRIHQHNITHLKQLLHDLIKGRNIFEERG